MRYDYNLGRHFETIAAQHGERPALRLAADHQVSYSELARTVDRMAHWLLQRGLRARDVLALFNDKRIEGYAAMLAALKIGAAYVNLDEQNPAARIGKILATCQPRLLVSDHPLPAEVDACCRANGAPPTRLPTPAELAALPAQRPPTVDRVTGSDPAYLMFTSGSTGTPKGVAIAHASVLNFIAWARSEFDLTPQDVLSGVNPVYFDNSVFDFYASLFSGAALAPLARATVAAPTELVRRIGELGCTLWFSVPSLLIYLTTLRQLRPTTWPAMRCLVFGGEGYPKPELKKLYDLFHPRCRLVNVYGPTEGTCICSACTLSDADFADLCGLPPLGRLAGNFAYLIQHADGSLAPPGEAGELCLLGPQLALGYYHDTERTAASFVAPPTPASPGERMYRTGDLVREDTNGVLWFVGRADNQIKHLGYRIELEEIEAALQALPQVRQAVVVYQRRREQHGEIVAFVSADQPLDGEAIRQRLRQTLPSYMIPGQIELLDELPKNANGKLDRRRLAEAALARTPPSS